MARLRFSSQQRLHSGREFQRVYAGGRRLGNEFFSVNVCRNESGRARLGLSIAAKTVGNAVARNRVRRLIRENFRLHHAQLPPLDIIIGARPKARSAPSAELAQSLEGMWKRIIAECAT